MKPATVKGGEVMDVEIVSVSTSELVARLMSTDPAEVEFSKMTLPGCVDAMEKRIAKLEAENARMQTGLKKIIEMNRQNALDQYGDANRAESWGCVEVAREALKEDSNG